MPSLPLLPKAHRMSAVSEGSGRQQIKLWVQHFLSSQLTRIRGAHSDLARWLQTQKICLPLPLWCWDLKVCTTITWLANVAFQSLVQMRLRSHCVPLSLAGWEETGAGVPPQQTGEDQEGEDQCVHHSHRFIRDLEPPAGRIQ